MNPAGFYTGEYQLFGKRLKGRLVIPSGIRCIRGSTIQRVLDEVPQIGVITTKSINLQGKAGYREPIYARYSSGSFINAVGLSNPGAEAFRDELAQVRVPAGKAILTSLFGGGSDDFARCAEILAPVSDGFELNMSCPHASGYGIEIGQDCELVCAIVRAVIDAAGLPVVVKLSSTLPRIADTAKACLEAGAIGFTLINTVGPSMVAVGNDPILSNRVGGLSGNAIRPMGLRAVEAVRRVIGPEPLIIGMGGIGTAEHIEQYRAMGADLFGVGSALTGLDSEGMRAYCAQLERDLLASAPRCSPGEDGPDSRVDMSYHAVTVDAVRHLTEELFELTLSRLPGVSRPGELAGRYYFLCSPGAGEKPFAVLSWERRAILVKRVGAFTKHLQGLAPGARILLRGPYGRPVHPIPGVNRYFLVGGGTGIASLPEIAAQVAAPGVSVHAVLGARRQAELYGLDDFARYGEVSVSTDDGSAGFHGRVSGLLDQILAAAAEEELSRAAVILCGPEPMIHACAAVARRFVAEARILGAVEYQTSCGVGICGKCAAPDGHLTCIDGPFLPVASFEQRAEPALKPAQPTVG